MGENTYLSLDFVREVLDFPFDKQDFLEEKIRQNRGENQVLSK